MGGNIFNDQGIKSRTIDLNEYEDISFEISTYCLGGAFKNHSDIRAFLNKKSFGDIDFLVSVPFHTKNNWKDYIINNPTIKQNTTHVAHNHNEEFSILYKGVQCDFRIIESKYWDSSIYFTADDPMGNCLGRIARFFGARFGYKGLYYPIYTENGCNHLSDVDLAIDPEEISNFFGLDHEKKVAGFNSVEDIFEYVVSSKYYSVECFDPKNWDSGTRTRNRKRKRFCDFLEYINAKYPIRKFQFLTYEDKHKYLEFMDEQFPKADLSKKVKAARKAYEVDKETLSKFDGHKAMELCGLTGAEFGKLFSSYKKAKIDWLEFLRSNKKKDIEQDFLDFYKK